MTNRLPLPDDIPDDIPGIAEQLRGQYEFIQARYRDAIEAGMDRDTARATTLRNIGAIFDIGVVAVDDEHEGLYEPDQAVGQVMALAEPPFFTVEDN